MYKVLDKYKDFINEELAKHPSNLLTMKDLVERVVSEHKGSGLQKEERHYGRALLAYAAIQEEGERTQAFIDMLYNKDMSEIESIMREFPSDSSVRIMWNLYEIHKSSGRQEVKLTQDAFRWLIKGS